VATIGVAATAPLGADVLERLASGHDVSFLLTRPDRPRGRGRRVGAPPAKEVAERLGIPVRQPERLDEAVQVGGVDAMVVAAYGALVPEALLGQTLWLNVHPSLLPRWRGAAPVERAIMAGDRETGVTIHRTIAELDAGPIAVQRAFPIEPEDDAGAVYAKAGELAAELLEDVLSGRPSFQEQSDEGATYAERLGPADRELDWDRPPEELLNRIRALSPHIGARGEVGGRTLTVWRARLAQQGSALTVGALELLEVQPEGRTRMSGAEYLRGLRPRGGSAEDDPVDRSFQTHERAKPDRPDDGAASGA
jgi:methionyl-tRNA formyltransferase